MRVRTELVMPATRNPRWRDQLADFEEVARKIEAALLESTDGDDAIRAVTRLSVPELADHCAVDLVEGDQSVRCVFANRDPRVAASTRLLMEHKAPLHAFAAGRRALAGHAALMRFTPAMFRSRPEMNTPEMKELIRLIEPTTGIFLPLTVLDTTVGVAVFARTAASGLEQGHEDLAIAHEVVRRAIIRHAGFQGRTFSIAEDARLRRADDFLRANLSQSFSLTALAREAGLSRFHLLRLFKEVYGETPFRRLARLRMEAAKHRLMWTRSSVTETALACGYDNPAHFANAFRRIVGVSPTQFRRLSR